MANEHKHYETTKQGIASHFDIHVRSVQQWNWIEQSAFELPSGDKAYSLAIIARIRHRKLEGAPQSRKIARESGSAVTYADKKDREQAWKLRYERLETQQKYVAKLYVQNSLRRWALAFPGPLKEFVALVVSMVPGHQKATVKEQGLAAISQCMAKVRDLAISFGAELEEEKPKRKRKPRKKASDKDE